MTLKHCHEKQNCSKRGRTGGGAVQPARERRGESEGCGSEQ